MKDFKNKVAVITGSAGGIGYAKVAAVELGALGIRVLAIAPGVFDTPIMGPKPSPVRTLFSKACSFPQREGKPSEFAQLVHHLVENTYFNGTTVEIDGDWHLGNWGTIMEAQAQA